MGSMPLLDMKDISRIYQVGTQEVRALDRVSLAVPEGQFLALIGASGSGKTTLLSLLGCLDQPDEGTYTIAGQAVQSLDAKALAKVRNKRIGFVFQAFNLLPRLRADENVALPLRYGGVPEAERLKRAREMLERVGLGDRVDHTPNELSGGQSQRVAIARALVTDPAMILADEPTGNLDSKSGQEILDLFRALHAEGRTLVMVTHDDDVAATAQRRVRLADGQIISDEETD